MKAKIDKENVSERIENLLLSEIKTENKLKHLNLLLHERYGEKIEIKHYVGKNKNETHILYADHYNYCRRKIICNYTELLLLEPHRILAKKGGKFKFDIFKDII